MPELTTPPPTLSPSPGGGPFPAATQPAQAQEPGGAFVLSEAERGLLPSEEDVRFYREHGWYLSKKLLADEEVAALVAASEAFYAGHRDRVLPFHPPALAYWEPGHGGVQRHNDYIHYESAAIAAVISKPVIGAVAAALAGTPVIRIFQTTLIYKPPSPAEPTNLVPWHADRHYWQTTTSDSMLTAFIPFHHCTPTHGTLTVIDRSHTWADIPGDDSTRHFAHRDRTELDHLLHATAAHNHQPIHPIPLTIPAGHMSFHHCRIYHGSGPNHAPTPRRALSLHLQDATNHYRPYRKPDGTPVTYNHDHLLRKTPTGHPDYHDPHYCPILWDSAAAALPEVPS